MPPVSTSTPSLRPARYRFTAKLLVILLVLLAGTALRFFALQSTDQRLGNDDSYYALDAASLIAHPRLTPFFPDNLGRESGWMYLLVPFLAFIGYIPFASHFASACVGILTIAAVYRLANVVLRGYGGVWSAAAIAAIFGHVAMSYIGYRAITYPLVAALALSFLLEAIRDESQRKWILGAIFSGLLAYTYFAARAVMLLCGLIMLVGLAKRSQRPGAIIAITLASLIALPQVLYTFTNPDAAIGRVVYSATLSTQSIEASIVGWLKMPFTYGDTNLEHNIPGRPLFDPAMGVLWVLGLTASIILHRRVYRQRPYAVLVFILAALAMLPSVISYGPPNTLRAIGLFIPLAILTGAGALLIEIVARQIPFRLILRLSRFGLMGLLAASAISTVNDIKLWVNQPGQYSTRRQYDHEAADYFKNNLSTTTPVYFNPEYLAFDNLPPSPVRLRAIDLRPRHVGTIDTRKCLAIPDVPSGYSAFENQDTHLNFVETMSPWATVKQLQQKVYVADAVTTYTQTIYLVTPKADLARRLGAQPVTLSSSRGAVFNMGVSSQFATTAAGRGLTVTLLFRALRPLAFDYRVTLSLVDRTDLYGGTNVWTKVDDAICDIYPGSEWMTSESIIRTFHMPIPAKMPSGRYELMIHVYGGIPHKSSENLAVSDRPADAPMNGDYSQPVSITATLPAVSPTVDTRALWQTDGYIREWRLIGGFPDATLRDDVLRGGEAAFNPPPDGSGTRLIRSQSRKIDLTRFIHPADHNVAYLYTWVKSPDNRKAFLGLNSDDGIAAWVNGKEVWRHAISRYVPDDTRDIDLPPVELKQGWNLLLLKVDQNIGEWAVKARVLNPDGSVMRDIQVAAQR